MHYVERLRHRLNRELDRLHNDYLFPWMVAQSDRRIVIQAIDGRKDIVLDGIFVFDNHRLVFWDRLKRYAENLVVEVFEEAEKELSMVQFRDRLKFLNLVEGTLITHLRQLATKAGDVDQKIRNRPTQLSARITNYPVNQLGVASVLCASQIDLHVKTLREQYVLKGFRLQVREAEQFLRDHARVVALGLASIGALASFIFWILQRQNWIP